MTKICTGRRPWLPRLNSRGSAGSVIRAVGDWSKAEAVMLTAIVGIRTPAIYVLTIVRNTWVSLPTDAYVFAASRIMLCSASAFSARQLNAELSSMTVFDAPVVPPPQQRPSHPSSQRSAHLRSSAAGWRGSSQRTATAAMPAFCAERTPGRMSSKTTHFSPGTPRRRAASR